MTEVIDKQEVKVGDIFYTSWGYDQTNVEFYKVVRATKSSVWIQQTGQTREDATYGGGDYWTTKSTGEVTGREIYNRETGEAALEKGIAKLISYGVLFLANPDLPKRFELNTDLNKLDGATMYGGKDQGYIDYPFLA